MSTTNFDISVFDQIHNRSNTGSIKHNLPADARPDTIPMWVADMDFQSPPAVRESLKAAAEHGIFGYTAAGDEYFRALTSWYARRMDWHFTAEQTLQAPGVMFGIAAAIRSLTAPNDKILICQPVYHPFPQVITANHRRCLVSKLRLNPDNNRYEIDFGDLEEKLADPATKMLLFCSPHNPTGRVWTREELLCVSKLCLKHDALIISDEIHSDFIYPGHKHIPIAALSAETADRTITCTAPTKTFNLPGIQAANLIITNPEIHKKVADAKNASFYKGLNAMAIAAVTAAYNRGEPWLDALLQYLQGNIRILSEGLANTDQIKLIKPDGTYLMWLDCRRLQLSDRELNKFFMDKAGLWLNSGCIFGSGGSGFMRMNIACPHSVMKEAVRRIQTALHEH